MFVLEAQEPFARYPIDDELVRRFFKGADLSTKEKMEKAKQLYLKLISKQNQQHEQFVREFLFAMARRYPNSGFETVGFAFFNTDSENAITFHVPQDDSYAIGLDYGMPSIFAFTFPTLLHVKLQGRSNLEWLLALCDIVQRQFYADGRVGEVEARTKERAMKRMIQENYLEKESSQALEMVFKFLIAHELGHIHLGHFKTKKATHLSTVQPGNDNADVSTFDHAAEYEADAFAMQALREIAGDSPIQQTLARHVPSIFFSIFTIAKMLYQPMTPLGRHFNSSHPDSWSRAQRLLPPASEKGNSSDPIIRAISDLPEVIATERNTPEFNSATADIQMRIRLMTSAHFAPQSKSAGRSWWKFWR